MTLSIVISIQDQRLYLLNNGDRYLDYSISTAKNGVGELENTGCTPLGLHRIKLKIGQNLPINSVLIGRRPTGEIYSETLREACPGRDWILSRILWLTGMERGRNRGGKVDTLRRYIYIHGCPDSESMGEPLSHGCIRMRNQDIIELFDLVPAGIDVNIISHYLT